MNVTKIVVSSRDIEKYKGELLVFYASQGEKEEIICDKRVSSVISPMQNFGDFKAKEQETLLVYPGTQDNNNGFAAARILVVGLGKYDPSSSVGEARELFRITGGTISKHCTQLRVEEVMIHISADFGLGKGEAAECLTEGVLLADYRFNKYKAEDEDNPAYDGLGKLVIGCTKNSAIKKAVQKAETAALATRSARDMANEPGNGWTPTDFSDAALKIAKKFSIKCKIIDKAAMKRLGMGGILAVNQGSAEPPKLVVLDYTPQKKPKATLLLVGKGLTFDSGGISLKPAAGMQDMKYDMCGGAAVLSAMQAIAEEKPDVRVIALVPSTDNMSGSKALKPGDIIRHYNGVTSEIVNTDAEGRLILADALAYGIEKFSPDYAVDVATLTGAVIIALGHHHTGLMSNNDDLSDLLVKAGQRCGEPIWRLPVGKPYTKQIDSEVADIKNAGGRPAGSITAAEYLQKFVGDTPWAHLDIAGTAWDYTEKSYIPKGPSGIVVRTLLELVRCWPK